MLDPIFSIRRRLRIPAGATARVAFWTVIAPTRAEVIDLADKHHDSSAFERAVTLAWTQAQVQLHHLRVDADEAHLFQRLANRVIYSDPTLRPSSDLLQRGVGGQSKLWPAGISGDLPIVLVRIDDTDDLEIVRELVRAHEYWRMKRLCVDLVILNERPPSYHQELQAALEGLVRTTPARSPADGQGACGNIFVLRADLVTAELRSVLQTVARAVLLSRRGTLSEQVKRLEMFEPAAGPPPRRIPAIRRAALSMPRREVEFFNGLGGFAADGREYLTILGEGQWTPAPWINVIANPSFGFQVSVEGAGYTWAVNSQQHQITQWSNDAVSDRPGEVLYVQDLDTGELWGPTARPIREDGAPYVVRHGHGYSIFEHTAHGISLELTQYVPLDDSIKISRLKIRNLSSRVRRLSVTAYVEWVLGTSRGASAPYIVTEIERETHAILARNSFQRRIRKPDRVRGPARPATLVDRGPNRVPRTQRHAGQSRGARVGQAAVRQIRCRDGSMRGAANHAVAQARTPRPRSFSFSARRRAGPKRSPRSRNIAKPTSTRRWPRSRSTGTTCLARFRSRRPTARWTSCSIDGCCIRRWRAACGRARPSTRRAARTAFAISCRT